MAKDVLQVTVMVFAETAGRISSQILESIGKLAMDLVFSIVQGGRTHGANQVWPRASRRQLCGGTPSLAAVAPELQIRQFHITVGIEDLENSVKHEADRYSR